MTFNLLKLRFIRFGIVGFSGTLSKFERLGSRTRVFIFNNFKC